MLPVDFVWFSAHVQSEVCQRNWCFEHYQVVSVCKAKFVSCTHTHSLTHSLMDVPSVSLLCFIPCEPTAKIVTRKSVRFSFHHRDLVSFLQFSV
jgi:hypothetical protein